MYFYNVLSIVLGLMALALAIQYTFKPKSYQETLNKKHFLRSEKTYCILNAILSFICGLALVIAGILEFIPSISFSNKEAVFVGMYVGFVAVYLIFSYIIERTYVEKPVVKNKVKIRKK